MARAQKKLKNQRFKENKYYNYGEKGYYINTYPKEKATGRAAKEQEPKEEKTAKLTIRTKSLINGNYHPRYLDHDGLYQITCYEDNYLTYY